jgi:hypothetical protein
MLSGKQQGSEPARLELLKGITGYAEPGTLTALMGGSGGCSSAAGSAQRRALAACRPGDGGASSPGPAGVAVLLRPAANSPIHPPPRRTPPRPAPPIRPAPPRRRGQDHTDGRDRRAQDGGRGAGADLGQRAAGGGAQLVARDGVRGADGRAQRGADGGRGAVDLGAAAAATGRQRRAGEGGACCSWGCLPSRLGPQLAAAARLHTATRAAPQRAQLLSAPGHPQQLAPPPVDPLTGPPLHAPATHPHPHPARRAPTWRRWSPWWTWAPSATRSWASRAAPA